MKAIANDYAPTLRGLFTGFMIFAAAGSLALSAQSDDAKKALEAGKAAAATFNQNFYQDRNRAIAAYSEAIRLDPNCAEAYLGRADINRMSGFLNEAIADITEAIRINPDSSDKVGMYWQRAMLYRRIGEHDRAIADFSEILLRNPAGRRASYVWRAREYILKGDYEHAIADYQAIIQFNPKDSDAWHGIALIYASCPDPNVRNGAKAVEYATKACEISIWGRARDLDTLAAAYAESGDFADAIKWEKKSLEGGLSDKEMEDASQRLNLYQHQQAYHETPKS